MGTSALSVLSGVQLDPDVFNGSDVGIGAIRRQMVRTGLQVQQESLSGVPWPEFQSVYAGAPMASWETLDLGAALGAVGALGLAIKAVSQTGLNCYGIAKQEGGGRKTGNNQKAFNIKEGFVYPGRLSAEHQKDAVLDLTALVTWDGTNAPIIPVEDVEALVFDNTARYSLGPCQLGTTSGDRLVITQKSRVEVNFGIDASAEGSDSDIFPTFASINEVANGMLRIVTTDIDLFRASGGIPIEGKDCDLSHTVFFFRRRKKVSQDGFEADNQAKHVMIVPQSGFAYHVDVFDGDSKRPATATIEIPVIGFEASPPLSITKDVQIVLPS